MTGDKSFLKCRCGACRITLCDPNMRYRSECLCCDCRQRELISIGKLPGSKLPLQVANYERGVDLAYFSNVLMVDCHSQNLLEFFMLREDSLSRTAISSCCGTLMCTSHPAARGNSIVVDADNCRVNVPHVIETQAVFWGSDFPPEKYEVRSKRDQIPKVFIPFEEAHTEPMSGAVAALSAPIAEQYKHPGCTTFEALCAEKKLILDNAYFEESRLRRPL